MSLPISGDIVPTRSFVGCNGGLRLIDGICAGIAAVK
jgi:hypothetical protein